MDKSNERRRTMTHDDLRHDIEEQVKRISDVVEQERLKEKAGRKKSRGLAALIDRLTFRARSKQK